MDEDKNLGKYSKYYRDVAPYLGSGLQLAVTVVVFFFIGRWIDSKADTSPLWMLIFAFLGITIGLYTFIKTVLQADKKRNK
jgi:F0F1-type ATP synthase assembly protein I